MIETAPGIHLHVWKGGPDSGPLAIFLHGFPEFAYAIPPTILDYFCAAPHGTDYLLAAT
jgi:hypothetical protein